MKTEDAHHQEEHQYHQDDPEAQGQQHHHKRMQTDPQTNDASPSESKQVGCQCVNRKETDPAPGPATFRFNRCKDSIQPKYGESSEDESHEQGYKSDYIEKLFQ